MTRKQVTTDATKAQLPRQRKRKPKGHIEALRKAFDEHRSNTDTPLTASDILASAGCRRASPCTEQSGNRVRLMPFRGCGEAHYIPPAAAPFPWPVRVLNWLDNAQFWTRQRLANGLRRMAARVAP